MSRILKKSLAIVLAVALCLSTMISGLSVFATDAQYTASYKITFGAQSGDEVTATLNVASTANDVSAVLATINLPGLPIKAISTDSVYELSTAPDYEESLPLSGLTEIRVLLNAKTTGATYNYANVYITFDASSKALVDMGIDPNASTAMSVAVDSIEISSYAGGMDGLESDTWFKMATDATTNSLGQAAADSSIKGSCSHAYTDAVITAPTCSATGTTRKTCSNCGYAYDVTTDKIAHTWGSYVTTTAPGCFSAGIDTRTCSVCKATEDKEIAAIGSHSFYAGEYDADPTHFSITAGDCSEEGTAYPICTRCQAIDEASPINIGYGAHDVSDWSIVSEPTCGAAGVREGECNTCFEFVQENYGTATGLHTWDAGVETTPPTSTTVGVMTYTCTECNETKTEDIPVLEECTHANKSAAAFEANAEGNYDSVIRCADCGEVLVSIATDIPATTAIKSTVKPSRMMYIGTSLGIGYVVTNSQVSSYTTYGVRVYRQTCDGDYNFYNTSSGEVSTFSRLNSSSKYGFYTGLALYELNLPVASVLVGYDASGNIVSVSNPMVDYPVDLLWATYNPSTSASLRTCCMDIVNLGSEAQLYFANEGSDLASVALSRDKYAWDQNDATQEVPSYDVSTMPNTITNNPSSTVSTTTYKLMQTISLASGSPTIGYIVMRGKNLGLDNLKLEVSYTSNGTKLSSTVVGSTKTDTTEPWVTSGTMATYTYSGCMLYDTNKTITAKFSYKDTEMYTSLYSVETYVAQNLATDGMVALMEAIAKFGPSARAYFNVA